MRLTGIKDLHVSNSGVIKMRVAARRARSKAPAPIG